MLPTQALQSMAWETARGVLCQRKMKTCQSPCPLRCAAQIWNVTWKRKLKRDIKLQAKAVAHKPELPLLHHSSAMDGSGNETDGTAKAEGEAQGKAKGKTKTNAKAKAEVQGGEFDRCFANVG